MSGVLSWDKPPKAIPHEEWLAISADCAPPGVYTPNMSEADRYRWKAALAGQRTPGELRAEIRKSLGSEGTGGSGTSANGWKGDPGKRRRTHAEALILVYEDGEVRMSANGQMAFSPQDWADLSLAVEEAREALRRYREARKEKGK